VVAGLIAAVKLARVESIELQNRSPRVRSDTPLLHHQLIHNKLSDPQFLNPATLPNPRLPIPRSPNPPIAPTAWRSSRFATLATARRMSRTVKHFRIRQADGVSTAHNYCMLKDAKQK
jgi:hypothetical protein